MYWVEEKGRKVVNLDRVVREDLREKMTFQQRLKRDEGVNHADTGGRAFWVNEQKELLMPVQMHTGHVQGQQRGCWYDRMEWRGAWLCV